WSLARRSRPRESSSFGGEAEWRVRLCPPSKTYTWKKVSTYIQHPPFFEGLGKPVPDITPISNARILALLGDSITTDHISPAGSIKADSPAGHYLQGHGVEPIDFNSYGSRREIGRAHV